MPPDNSERHEGGCRCGAVRFAATEAPHFSSYCHCDDCRRATGAPVVAFVGFYRERFDWSAGVPSTFGRAPVRRFFCSDCGSPLGYHDERIGDRIYMYTAAMDRPELYPPQQHAYAGDQLPWLHLTDDLPRSVMTTVERPKKD